MPTYEYRCKDCGEHLEVVQKFTDDPLTECPNCQGPLRKVFGSIGIVLKGSGFYKNDSRASGGGKSTKESTTSDSSSNSDSKKSDSPKSESKNTESSSPSAAAS